jgi:ABC-2 type transport system ATP-binding protein
MAQSGQSASLPFRRENGFSEMKGPLWTLCLEGAEVVLDGIAWPPSGSGDCQFIMARGSMHLAQMQHVSMRYGAVQALHDVSLDVSAHETVALLGPNGAGKSTAIGLLTGLKRAQEGCVRLLGRDPRIPSVRSDIGVTPQEAAFPMAWRVGEILDFARSHYATPAPRLAIIEAFGLGSTLHRAASQLSGGQQRKLAVALAFSGAPKAVFLDEPTTGLDIDARKQLWAYVSQYKSAGGAVFLTTHYLEEAEVLADRIILMNEGVIVRSGTVAEVKGAVGVRIIRFDALHAPDLPSARLHESAGVRHSYVSHDADQAIRELVNQGVAFSALEVLHASLSDAVSELLKGVA